MCSDDGADYAPMQQASDAAMKEMTRLGRDQMEQAQKQYDEVMPMMREISDLQTQVMTQNLEAGKDYSTYMKETFRPLERGLVSDVNKYNTFAESERLAEEAAATVEAQATGQRKATERSMASMGINPTSGKYQAAAKQTGLKIAGVKAGAMTSARNLARETGFQKKLAVTQLGKTLPGDIQSAYRTATGAGSSAASNILAPGSQLTRDTATGVGTIDAAHQTNLSAQRAILDAQARESSSDFGNIISGVGDLARGAAAMGIDRNIFGEEDEQNQ